MVKAFWQEGKQKIEEGIIASGGISSYVQMWCFNNLPFSVYYELTMRKEFENKLDNKLDEFLEKVFEKAAEIQREIEMKHGKQKEDGEYGNTSEKGVASKERDGQGSTAGRMSKVQLL